MNGNFFFTRGKNDAVNISGTNRFKFFAISCGKQSWPLLTTHKSTPSSKTHQTDSTTITRCHSKSRIIYTENGTQTDLKNTTQLKKGVKVTRNKWESGIKVKEKRFSSTHNVIKKCRSHREEIIQIEMNEKMENFRKKLLNKYAIKDSIIEHRIMVRNI